MFVTFKNQYGRTYTIEVDGNVTFRNGYAYFVVYATGEEIEVEAKYLIEIG